MKKIELGEKIEVGWNYYLNSLARRTNAAVMFACPTSQLDSPGRRAMVIAHPCHSKNFIPQIQKQMTFTLTYCFVTWRKVKGISPVTYSMLE
jgi:hypothetical protein